MSEMANVFGIPSKTTSKVDRYGWSVKDIPGEIKLLHKNEIKINPTYQRQAIEQKIQSIAAEWSWVALGAIIVGEREGEYWVIDGQHRIMGARRRADVSLLPCVVFQTESVKQEARGFLDVNTGRKAVKGIDTFRAKIAAQDPTAMYVDSVFRELGVTICYYPKKGLELKCVAWAVRRASEDPHSFQVVMRAAVDIGKESVLYEIFLDGLLYIQTHSSRGLTDKRLYDRLKKVGVAQLLDGARRASAYYTRGGAKIWAEGMISAINKGLRHKITLDSSDDICMES